MMLKKIELGLLALNLGLKSSHPINLLKGLEFFRSIISFPFSFFLFRSTRCCTWYFDRLWVKIQWRDYRPVIHVLDFSGLWTLEAKKKKVWKTKKSIVFSDGNRVKWNKKADDCFYWIWPSFITKQLFDKKKFVPLLGFFFSGWYSRMRYLENYWSKSDETLMKNVCYMLTFN